MKILVLNGSPRPQGSTAKMVSVFKEAAEAKGHEVVSFNVCKMNIKGCLACEYCHGKGHGECVQKDDMREIYTALKDAEMLVLAAPIYYQGISGQLKCVIDRFYSALYPTAPGSLKKVSMFLSSGSWTSRWRPWNIHCLAKPVPGLQTASPCCVLTWGKG